MPVTMVCCCADEGVKVPPLELTIEDIGVLAQTHSSRAVPRSLDDERRSTEEVWTLKRGVWRS
jgi:hypothetical protein